MRIGRRLSPSSGRAQMLAGRRSDIRYFYLPDELVIVLRDS
jgi:hypothetical protein